MKILVDENIPFAEETFGRHGEIEKFAGRQLQPADLKGVEALITRSITRVDQQLLSQHQPGFVGTCTAGKDHLDMAYLESRGITWVYAPGCNAQSVVDYVRSVVAVFASADFPERVGIVGCGSVGGLLREHVLEMGSELRVYDPFLDTDQIPELGTLNDVFQSDLVCLHTPFTTRGPHPTANMVALAQLAKLPENAIVISAGRGGVMAEDDLLEFMRERPDLRVALDVWANEPEINAELLQRVTIATPHIAGYSLEGKRRGTEQVYQSFCRHFSFAPVQLSPLESAGELSSETDELALLEAYDPRRDTLLMREGYTQASAGYTAGGWFDFLRKNYPERREFASFSRG